MSLLRSLGLVTGDKYPAEMPNTATNGGWADFVKLTNAGSYYWSNYVLLQDDLGQAPKVLVCPADTRKPAKDFKSFGNKNISYFMGIGANENFPLSILGGDRNLAPGSAPKNDFGYSPDEGTGNDVILQTNSPICWSLKNAFGGQHCRRRKHPLGRRQRSTMQQCSSQE